MTSNQPAGDAPETPVEESEDRGGPKGYPRDPGGAYESEPEPADESFSEHSHWVGRSDR